MWDWFLPAGERDKYRFAIMEGGGGGGPTPPETIAWMWGWLFGIISGLIIAGCIWLWI